MCFPTSKSRSLVLHFFNKLIQTVLLDLNLGNYVLQSCNGGKEMYQNVWYTCIVIVLLIWHIAFLKFLLLLWLWHFKLPNVLHGHAISKLHNLSLNHQCKGVLYCALLLLFMLLFLKLLFVIVNVWNSIYLNWWRMIDQVKYIVLKAVTKKRVMGSNPFQVWMFVGFRFATA